MNKKMEQLSQKIINILADNTTEIQKSNEIEGIGDILRGETNDELVTNTLNTIIDNIHGKSDYLKESMLNTISTSLEDNYDYDYNLLHLDNLVSEIDNFGEHELGYVINLLEFSGNAKYLPVFDGLLQKKLSIEMKDNIKEAKEDIEYSIEENRKNTADEQA